ncbi:hypothetical protein [Schlesneria paludicola]|uniref:hypothetical protein n=1 Tax=Schlesneria paludicola TaxID=360056 RepID=UPI0012FB9C63|nr:hypothetical protein [Schlesneria paludicola]
MTKIAPPASSVNSAVEGEPTVIIKTVQEFHDLLELNSFNLKQQFPTETIEVSGVVADLCMAEPGHSTVCLKRSSEPESIKDLHAPVESFKVAESQVWARISRGQLVTLHGRTTEGDHLSDFVWRVVKQDRPQSLVMTAQEFSDEFAKDTEAAIKKFLKHQFYLTGRVGSFEKLDGIGAAGKLIFKVERGLPPEVLTSYIDWETIQIENLKPESPIAALCELYFGYEFAPTGLDEPNIILSGIPITVSFPVLGVEYQKELPSGTENRSD